jgi:hypothetical protein
VDTRRAVSEPLRRIKEQHEGLNRTIKLLFGSLNKVMEDGLKDNQTTALPNGEEPWGPSETWASAADGYAAAELLAELGIVRAASAFEDYLQGVIAEIDRSQKSTPSAKNADLLEQVLVRLAMSAEQSFALVRFFDCARNCIVHQMGRANANLVALSDTRELFDELAVSSARRNAKWKPELPPISLGEKVVWKPRHAILASDAYYKSAVEIDRQLVNFLGPAGLVAMASHWAVVAPLAGATARSSLIATIGWELHNRYLVRLQSKEIAPLLKSVDRWERAKSVFHAKYPDRSLD